MFDQPQTKRGATAERASDAAVAVKLSVRALTCARGAAPNGDDGALDALLDGLTGVLLLAFAC